MHFQPETGHYLPAGVTNDPTQHIKCSSQMIPAVIIGEKFYKSTFLIYFIDSLKSRNDMFGLRVIRPNNNELYENTESPTAKCWLIVFLTTRNSKHKNAGESRHWLFSRVLKLRTTGSPDMTPTNANKDPLRDSTIVEPLHLSPLSKLST